VSKNVSTSSSSSGIGFAGLLTIAFIVLKLTSVIAWSWLWVLSPLWISAALALVALLIFAIIMLIIAAVDR
jgi:membrane protein YdbS with pleckstrin-like domain